MISQAACPSVVGEQTPTTAPKGYLNVELLK
jgi:hypothetical protein